jgi:hypothetical protein
LLETIWISVGIPSLLSLAQQGRLSSFSNKPLLTTEHGGFKMYLTLMEGNLVLIKRNKISELLQGTAAGKLQFQSYKTSVYSKMMI